MPDKKDMNSLLNTPEADSLLNHILASLEARGQSTQASFCSYDFSSIAFMSKLMENEVSERS